MVEKHVWKWGTLLMDRSKVLEFFDGKQIKEDIHIVGCGAIGSHVAEELARIGCYNIHLWDFDVVSPHNITNQMFSEGDIGRPKVDAVYEMMISINKELKDSITIHNCPLEEPWILNGYIFMCADSIDVRRSIVNANKNNPYAIAVFDFRMRLTDAQHYAAEFRKKDQVKELLKTMDFTDEEAKAATPVSACGVELSVVYTVKTIVACGICNFVKFIQQAGSKTKVFVDMNFLAIDAF